MKNDFKNLLYLNNGSIGDLLMALYFLENIHAAMPDTKIVVFAPKNTAFHISLAAGYPYVRVVGINRRSMFRYAGFLGRHVLQKNMLVLPQTFGTFSVATWLFSFLLTRMPGSRIAGFDDRSRTARVLLRPRTQFNYDQLYYENLQTLLEDLSVPVAKESPGFLYTETGVSVSEKKYAVVHMLAASPLRSLPEERWVGVLEHILETTKLDVRLSGAPSDREYLEKVRGMVSDVTRVHVSAGLSAQEVASLIAKAVFFVGPDTGVTHLAALLRQKTIVIGNLSNPTWLPYYSEMAQILFEKKNCVCGGRKNTQCYVEEGGQKYLRCMLDIPQARIYEEIDGMYDA